ncbi:efflux RND transporter periplasmic adaptor subunit [Micromonospora rifamycinica]|uniref:efflux RND transporter periplasmic adaptor subunit n=1 Tax=Micromonospora rifamycinica TaxID=291594 RepID=UPI0033E76439
MPAEQPPAQSPARRTGRRIVVPAVLVLMASAIGAGVVWAVHRVPPEPSARPPVAVETVTVVRADLSATVSLTGTLGYGLAEPVKGGRSGTVTWLPEAGATISRGRQLYRVDDQPVPLFYGGMPLYRDLAEPGTVGRDVRIVATNLKALGYEIGDQPAPGQTVSRPAAPGKPAGKPAAGADEPTADPSSTAGGTAATLRTRVVVRKGDGVLTGSLIRAVRRWQRDVELPVTGRIAVGDVAVLPGAVRVDSVTALRGDDAATPLLTVTPTAKVITVLAGATEAGTIHRGDQVTVTLPGDKTVDGSVSAVSTTVQPDGEGAGPGGAEPKRAVTVTVDDDLAGIDAAEVQVDLAGETRSDVLAVPVGALVALSEGGYALQLTDGRLVAVTTGMFAKGMVEVSGDGLSEDLRVVTTS